MVWRSGSIEEVVAAAARAPTFERLRRWPAPRLPASRAEGGRRQLSPIRPARAAGRMESMIARIWRGWAPAALAGAYQEHFEREVRARLARVDGFVGARLWRREERDEVEFVA